MREIRLYDSLSGELVPVSAGDAIRVEVRGLPVSADGYVDVESTRPLVLFSFLERFLRREGFATKFLFDSPDDDDTLYEIAEGREAPVSGVGGTADGEQGAELDGERRAELDGEQGAERDGEQRAERDGEQGPELDGEQGAERDGERRAELDGEQGAERDGEQGLELDGEQGAELDGERRAEPDGEQDGEQDIEMSLLEVQRSDVEQWVNVCFGAGREGAAHGSATSGERVLLSHALEEFGHSAVALYLLGTHYSLPLGDAHAGLIAGSRNASSIRKALERLVPDQPSPPDMRHYVEDFRDALADDLDTPTAFVVMFEWLLEAERRGNDVGDNDLRVMLEVFELEHLAARTGVS